MLKRGRAERSLRAGRTRVSVRSVDISTWSGAGDEATCPEMADCFLFLEGAVAVGRRVLGPGELENWRGGEESALANIAAGHSRK